MFDGFTSAEVDAGAATIFVRQAGSGPPLLLLHGFPQTHAMWAQVAPRLTDKFSVVCADLRGYGRSGCPSSAPDHAPYSKRAMALDMVGAMRALGYERFAVAGHDRGGRVAYRLALDHPERVTALAVLDILPTEEVWRRADARLALAFWPWSLLAQPEPLPERLMAAAPEAVVDDASVQWGSAKPVFSADARAAYIEALRDPGRVHAICEEYRAAATIDRDHDREDLLRGNRIACPTLALWSRSGALQTWYESEGGPLALWQRWCDRVEGEAVDAGHFFPEEIPPATTQRLSDFFQRTCF
ncbi:MAG TPA: alpha/beta hydrolase [Luteimonas sp.]|nr:alpha/beta hydrolase [Luteimonas sp.]